MHFSLSVSRGAVPDMMGSPELGWVQVGSLLDNNGMLEGNRVHPDGN
jgi:hypothetical protein